VLACKGKGTYPARTRNAQRAGRTCTGRWFGGVSCAHWPAPKTGKRERDPPGKKQNTSRLGGGSSGTYYLSSHSTFDWTKGRAAGRNRCAKDSPY